MSFLVDLIGGKLNYHTEMPGRCSGIITDFSICLIATVSPVSLTALYTKHLNISIEAYP